MCADFCFINTLGDVHVCKDTFSYEDIFFSYVSSGSIVTSIMSSSKTVFFFLVFSVFFHYSVPLIFSVFYYTYDIL